MQCDICPEIFDLATENLNKIRRLRKQRVSSPSFFQPRCQGEPPSLQIDEVLESLLLDQSPSQPPYSSDHASPAASSFSGGRCQFSTVSGETHHSTTRACFTMVGHEVDPVLLGFPRLHISFISKYIIRTEKHTNHAHSLVNFHKRNTYWCPKVTCHPHSLSNI